MAPWEPGTAGISELYLGARTTLSSALIHSPGFFFFYPHKLCVHLLVGDSYEVGYKYFRRDHSSPTNLCLHVVSLGWQLLGNFGLLAAVDKLASTVTLAPWLDLARPLSALSAICWGGVLLFSPAPLVVSLASAASIGGAYWVAPLLAPRELELGAMTLFLTVQVLSKFAFPQSSMRQAESRTVPSSKLASQDVAGGTLHTCKLFGLALAFRFAAVPWRAALKVLKLLALLVQKYKH
jgi:hypothetical protein